MASETRGLPPRLALFFACIPLFGWWMTGLFDLDEGFYGAVVAEMNRRGEWITPFYNGSVWFEKPILLYWLAKPCVMLFGIDFGIRLPSVICTILLFVVCGFFAKRRYGTDAQTATYFCLGTSILVIALGRLMMTDAVLNLCLATAFLSFYESLVGNQRWRILTGFSLGMGVLAKGPVALILFGIVVGIALWRDKSLRQNLNQYWGSSLFILAATISSWYVPCYMENGDYFVQKFLIEQNYGRFVGGDAAHSLGLAGLPIYIPVIALAVLPWGWIERKAFTKANLDDSFSRFLLTWALVIFVFFSISGAKLPHYVLPVVPAMALLVSKRMSQSPRVNWRPEVMMGLPVVLLLILDPFQRFYYQESGQQEAHAMVRKHPEIQAFFQLGKQEKVLYTGTTRLQETSLPSLVMYMNKQVFETDDPTRLNTISQSSKSLIFFTRNSRIPGLEAATRGSYSLKVIDQGENFGVYQLEQPDPKVTRSIEVKEITQLINTRQEIEAILMASNVEAEFAKGRIKPIEKPVDLVGGSWDAVLFDTSSKNRGKSKVFLARKVVIPHLQEAAAPTWQVNAIEEKDIFGVYQLIAK